MGGGGAQKPRPFQPPYYHPCQDDLCTLMDIYLCNHGYDIQYLVSVLIL